MTKYVSNYTKRKITKVEFEPRPLTILMGYRANEVINECLSVLDETINKKGYILVADLYNAFFLINEDYEEDSLNEYGWDSKDFRIDDLRIEKSRSGLYYVKFPEPIKMAL